MKQSPEARRANSIRRIETSLSLSLAAALGFFWLFGTNAGPKVEALQAAGEGVNIPWAVGGLIAFMLIAAMFVAAHTGLVGLRPVHAKAFREKEDRRADRLEMLIEDRSHFQAALSFGAQTARLGIVFCGFLFAPDLANQLGFWFNWHVGYPLILLSALIIAVPVLMLNLVVVELVPKSYAEMHPINTSLALYRITRLAAFLFSAPAALTTWIAGLLTARFGGKPSFSVSNQTEEEIKTLVENAPEEIEEGERELLHSVFEFTDTVAREVMTPRVDVDAAPIKTPINELIELIQKSGHSRIPLFEDTDDQIVGIIHAKDLLMATIKAKANINLRTLMRPALFVPENKSLHELLGEMRNSRSQMAVVQDEFGGTAGIVTIEDIVEELVGDIVDEYDVEEPDLVEVEGGHLVDGRMHVDDVNHALGSEFDSEEFDTIGGYVFGVFGRQPKPLEEVESEGYIFRVVETDGRRLQRLLIRASESQSGQEEPSYMRNT